MLSPLFRERTVEAVHRQFLRCGVDVHFAQTSNAAELLTLMDTRSFELLFLDIDMPGMDGIRLGEELRNRGCGADIIYLSNMEDKVYEIFRVHPWSFVRKSRLDEELPCVIEEYVASLRRQGNSFLATGPDGQVYSFAPEELIYIEASGKIQKVFILFLGRNIEWMRTQAGCRPPRTMTKYGGNRPARR